MQEILAPLEWYTVQRKVSELVPYEYNPRKISDLDKERLKKSLEKFNLVEIPVIDIDNTLIGGHQRVIILFELGRGEEIIDVRIPNRKLTEDEFKEYNLRSNILNGEFDYEKISEFFSDINLTEIGFDINSFNDFIQSENDVKIEIEEEEKGEITLKSIDYPPNTTNKTLLKNQKTIVKNQRILKRSVSKKLDKISSKMNNFFSKVSKKLGLSSSSSSSN